MKTALSLALLSVLILAGGCATAPANNASADQGSLLSDGEHPPRVIQQCPPIYPLELRKQGVIGYAVIAFIVDAEGNVRDPWVVEATVKDFGYAAIGCVSQWKFEPGRKAGRKVNTRMTVPIYFQFNETAQPSNASGQPEPSAPTNGPH